VPSTTSMACLYGVRDNSEVPLARLKDAEAKAITSTKLSFQGALAQCRAISKQVDWRARLASSKN
jgi:hypothetical protein